MSTARQIVRHVKDDLKLARGLRLRWWAIIALLIPLIPVIIIADNHDHLAQAVPVINWCIVMAFAFWVKWPSRGEVWFWGPLTLTTIVVSPLIYLTHWKELNMPFRAFGGVDVLALIVLFALMALARVLFETRRRS